MRRSLVLCAAALLMASAADATDRGNAQRADHAVKYATWREGSQHGWGVAPHHRCVVPDVCASGYYAYGYWTGQPKTECSCQSGPSRY